MLKRWSEIGVGRHWTESARILCPSREDYGKLQEEFSLLSELTERHGTRYLLSEWRDGSALLQITVYEDRSFTFVTKTPPAAELIKKAAGVAKGSPSPHADKIGSLTTAQVREIAESKMADLNANDVEAATKIIAGTARSMGITVEA